VEFPGLIDKMAVDIANWLLGLGLQQYEKTFRDNDIDSEILPKLTAEDLTGIGISSVGHRRKLIAAIAGLGTPHATTVKAESLGALNQPAHRSYDAERRHLTVMFVDLVGSTALSGRLDPEDMRTVITRYQNTVAGVVTRFEGHVAKYMGDGVLC
jgi:SAM domain (Sterile alpha motif)